jgi:thioredoxin 1
MATIKTVTEENFDELTSSGIVLLDWWAGWCGPCRMFAPIFEAAARRHADVSFGKVDTEAQSGLAGDFGIRSIPTLSVFRDGILVFSQPGMLPAPVLDELIADVKALDMAEVRRVVAEETKQRTAG